jgi:hypothetical protein
VYAPRVDRDRFDIDKLGDRSKRAYWAISDLYDSQWHSWQKVVGIMLAASDITAKSCSDILRGMEHVGEVVRRGTFSPRRDSRELLFLDLDLGHDVAVEWEIDGMNEAERDSELARRAQFRTLRERVANGGAVAPAEWEAVSSTKAWESHQKMSSR